MASATPGVSSNLKEAEDLAQLLSEAINCGNKQEAMRYSEQLADLAVPVSVKLCQGAYSQDTIRLKVGVEDAQLDSYIPITMTVTYGMTIAQLKQKVNHDYGFHPSLQSWVIGKRLARDTDTLYSHGVRRHGDQAFLFIKSAHAANLTREQQKQDEDNQRIDDIIESITIGRLSLQPRGLGDLAAGKKQGGLDDSPQQPPKTKLPPHPPPKPQVGWTCPQCTYVNKPTRPGCEICSSERPPDYRVPDLYKPDKNEAHRMQQEEMAHLQYQQALVDEREKNFRSLLETDSHSLIFNTEDLDCPICLCSITPGEGATLRECLHSFCKECLKGTIVNCLDAEVTCPFVDEAYTCNYKLQDREIRSGEYQKFMELRLSIAESRSENSYHCKTPDCAGWCIFEDDVNEFVCELCNKTNCILCKAIHKGMDCKQYQDDLHIRAQNDIAAKQTTEMLNALLQNGEAMYCPKCKVIVQKKGGCDWICCLMCKTEICWVTRQARWGPQGSGDTTGGCRCRANGNLCHPNCQNCH